MKHTIKIMVLFAVLASCSSSKEINRTNEIVGPAEIVQGIAELNSFSTLKTDSTKLVLGYSFFQSKGKELLPYQDSVNYKIIDFVEANTEFENTENKTSQLKNNFFHNQLEKFDSLSRLESDLLEEGNLWELEGQIEIKEEQLFTQLELSIWTYTGGAHGNGYSGYFMIDHSTGSELSLSEFILDIDTFTSIAESYFRKENEIDPQADLTELGFWFTDGIFRCNENFYFADDKINFLFNNYEIAPYSAGQLHFSIPLSEIKDLLKIQP